MMYLIQITLLKKEVFLITSLNPYFFAQYNSPVGYTEKFCHFETISLARKSHRGRIVFYGAAVHIVHNVQSGKKTPSKLLWCRLDAHGFQNLLRQNFYVRGRKVVLLEVSFLRPKCGTVRLDLVKSFLFSFGTQIYKVNVYPNTQYTAI